MKSRNKGLNLTKVVLSGKVVRLFSLCRARLSSQLHYDFGLRALKTVLGGVGRLKRELTREQEQEQGQGQAVREVCAEMGLEAEGEAEQWVSKVGQLSRVSSMALRGHIGRPCLLRQDHGLAGVTEST